MRIEKVAILNEVTARVKDSDYCFILNYGGVDVVKIGKFRTALKAHDSRLLIVKNTFLAKVAKEKGWSDEVNAMLAGNTAIVTGHGEPTAVTSPLPVTMAVGPVSMAWTSSDQPFSFAAFARKVFLTMRRRESWALRAARNLPILTTSTPP